MDDRALVEEVARIVNENDPDGIPAVIHPDMQFTSVFSPMEGQYSGRDGVRAYLADLRAAFDTYELTVEQVRPVGENLLVYLRATGRGRGSGVEVDSEVGQVWTLRDGLAWRVAAYPTREEAHAALGLAT